MAWHVSAEGRQPWSQVRPNMPRDCVAVWSDIDGFHVGQPPEALDGVTHLWVAAPDASWRYRIDGTEVIGARLEESQPGSDRAVEVSVQARSTPDDALAGLLREAVGLTALAVTGPTGEAWFLAVRK